MKAILFLGEQTLFEVQLLFSRLEINKSSSFSYDSRGTGDESLWVGSEQRWGKGGWWGSVRKSEVGFIEGKGGAVGLGN